MNRREVREASQIGQPADKAAFMFLELEADFLLFVDSLLLLLLLLLLLCLLLVSVWVFCSRSIISLKSMRPTSEDFFSVSGNGAPKMQNLIIKVLMKSNLKLFVKD